MRKNYIKFLFSSLLAISLNTQAQTNACNELFISEIVYAKDQVAVSGNSPIDNSYAIELFNPKGDVVDLSGYSIKLAQNSGADISINLTGTINPKGKFTVAFSGSDVPLTAIADLLKSDLNFEEKTLLELWGPNGIIDRIGQVNLSQADVINLTAALADPLNYLNTLNLNLTSLQNFTARRKYSENQGDPNFIQPADKWEIAQNGDISNLGQFNNVCSDAPNACYDYLKFFATGQPTQFTGDLNTIGANNIPVLDVSEGDDVDIVTEVGCINSFQAASYSFYVDMTMYYAFVPSACDNNPVLFTTANENDVDYSFNNNSAAVSNISTSPGSWTTLRVSYITGLLQTTDLQSFRIHINTDNIIEQQEVLPVVMTTTSNGQAAAPCMYLRIKDANSNGISELTKNEITVYPNPTSNFISINNKNIKFDKIEIINQLGQTYQVQNNSSKIDISNFSNGVYTIKMTKGNDIVVKHFVKS